MIENENIGFFVDFLPTFQLNAPVVISNEQFAHVLNRSDCLCTLVTLDIALNITLSGALFCVKDSLKLFIAFTISGR